jgi:hypothetical protein
MKDQIPDGKYCTGCTYNTIPECVYHIVGDNTFSLGRSLRHIDFSVKGWPFIKWSFCPKAPVEQVSSMEKKG